MSQPRHAMVERLEWDSSFFGRPVGRARTGRLDFDSATHLVEEARAASLECVYFVAAADDRETVQAAEANGFHLVDVRLVLERSAALPLAPRPADESWMVGPPRDDELPRLQELAQQVAVMSRYAFDPRFTPEETERLYRVWIANALRGYADAVLVARESPGGAALGFLCCKMHGELCDLQLAGVDAGYRHRHLGRALFEAGIGWGLEHAASRIQIVTQVRNVAAQRLFQQLGFLTTEVKLCYHLWLEPPASLSPRTA